MTPYLNGILGLIFAVAITISAAGAFAGSTIIHVLAALVAILAIFGLIRHWIDHPSERRTK